MTTPDATYCQRRGRARYRPPAGVPLEREARWGAPLSLVVHVIVVVLLLVPFFGEPERVPQRGAGGPGPSGGGGGGAPGSRASASSGGPRLTERLHYAAVSARPEPLAPPERTEPKPEPVERVPPKPRVPEAPVAKVEPVVQPSLTASTASRAPQVMLVPGSAAGGGGESGSGSGTGGGVGTGTGTGRGSATGPGTGGGEGTIYPATPDFLVMPALPVPKGVRGKTIELRFTLDERGRIVKVEFESTGDASYDRELRERLEEYRFRPAHKMDGTPVPSVYVTRLTL